MGLMKVLVIAGAALVPTPARPRGVDAVEGDAGLAKGGGKFDSGLENLLLLAGGDGCPDGDVRRGQPGPIQRTTLRPGLGLPR